MNKLNTSAIHENLREWITEVGRSFTPKCAFHDFSADIPSADWEYDFPVGHDKEGLYQVRIIRRFDIPDYVPARTSVQSSASIVLRTGYIDDEEDFKRQVRNTMLELERQVEVQKTLLGIRFNPPSSS